MSLLSRESEKNAHILKTYISCKNKLTMLVCFRISSLITINRLQCGQHLLQSKLHGDNFCLYLTEHVWHNSYNDSGNSLP